MGSVIRLYRNIAITEGVSYLLLLFIAMPLKYLFQIPEPVKYIGWAHGILFVAYIAALLLAAIKYKWTITRVIYYFMASLIPFLPFIIEKQLKKEYAGA